MAYPITLSDLSTMDDLSSSLKQAKNKLCVVMFTAGWCNPCKTTKKKIFDETTKRGLSVDLKDNAAFFYVDIDHNKELAEEFKITSIPHFFLMKCESNEIEMKCNFKGGSDLTEQKIRANF